MWNVISLNAECMCGGFKLCISTVSHYVQYQNQGWFEGTHAHLNDSYQTDVKTPYCIYSIVSRSL